MSSRIILIYCPFPTPEAARQVCLELLKEQLIACGNLLPMTEAHYWWEGTLTMSTECVLLAKTSAERVDSAAALIAQLHPYACPAILRVDAVANPAYAAWVENMTRDSILPKASD